MRTHWLYHSEKQGMKRDCLFFKVQRSDRFICLLTNPKVRGVFCKYPSKKIKKSPAISDRGHHIGYCLIQSRLLISFLLCKNNTHTKHGKAKHDTANQQKRLI